MTFFYIFSLFCVFSSPGHSKLLVWLHPSSLLTAFFVLEGPTFAEKKAAGRHTPATPGKYAVVVACRGAAKWRQSIIKVKSDGLIFPCPTQDALRVLEHVLTRYSTSISLFNICALFCVFACPGHSKTLVRLHSNSLLMAFLTLKGPTFFSEKKPPAGTPRLQEECGVSTSVESSVE
jgi:hypothetical protein